MGMAQTRRAGSTTGAAVVIFVETALFVLVGVVSLILGVALSGRGKASEFAPLGRLGDLAGGLLAGAGILILALCALSLVVGISILRRRVWARWTGVVMFSVFGLLMLVGLFNSRNGGSPAFSFLLLATDVAVVVLLVIPATTQDFAAANTTMPIFPPPPSPPMQPPTQPPTP